jgi:hypothetical protein
MKRTLLTAIIMLSASAAALAQSYATARIFESQAKDLSRIMLMYEDGTSELIPLQAMRWMGGAASVNEVMTANQKSINTLLNTMQAKGYKVESQSTAMLDAVIYTLIVFRKG